jgi:hypothetical protein
MGHFPVRAEASSFSEAWDGGFPQNVWGDGLWWMMAPDHSFYTRLSGKRENC